MILYMAVTADQYELPIAIETTAMALALKCGTSANSVFSSISKNYSGRKSGIKFMRIETDEN